MLKRMWVTCVRSNNSKVKKLHSQADILFDEFEQGKGTNYIDEAIVLDRQALELCPTGRSKRQASLIQLQSHIWVRYNQLGQMEDIEEAIVLAQEAVSLCPQGDPYRSTSLMNVATFLSARYRTLGEMADIDEAVVLGREATSLCPQGHPGRSPCLSNVADFLATRYGRYGANADLDEAIAFAREALDLCPQDHPDRSTRLNNAASHVFTRYMQHGEMADIEEVIVLGREALDLCAPGHPDQPMYLNNLAVRLSNRYNQFGQIEDLNEAIIFGRKALNLCLRSHPNRSRFLNNIQAHLTARHKQLGAMEDLNDALVFGKEALDLCPRGHVDRSIRLNNVAVVLSTRYKHLKERADIDEAIILAREVLDLFPQGHPDRCTSLNNLAVYLSERNEQSGEVGDLDEAIVFGREGLNLFPQGHPHRPASVDSLADQLFARYSQLGTLMDLDEAILLAQDALQWRPFGHPDRSRSLEKLASYFRARFTQLGQLGDKEELFIHYTGLMNLPQTVSSADLDAAKAWVSAAEDFHHPTTLLAYETSLRLLIQHLTTLPSLPQHLPILRKLTSSLAVDAFSAHLRNHNLTNAVELLEQGRGVFWNQISRLRFPLDDVIESGPEGKSLADEFTRLTSLIREAMKTPGEDQHDQVFRLNLDMQRVVTSIRELPGFARFLLPPSFSDLQSAASAGPVIIVNASEYTCDALVVLIDQEPVHIPLTITKARVRDLSKNLRSLTVRAKTMDVKSDLGRLLRELWEDVVSPVVDFLKTTLPVQSRIWWCPTAEFSLLPLHAAGPYRKGERNLSQCYVSSYTPTLTALIRARRQGPSNSTAKVKRFIAIGQANASGENKLVSVGSELDIVGQRVEGVATFTRVEGPNSCISRVSEELGRSEWAHFACHGIPNRQRPFDSAFALHDGRFTIQHIMRCELENPEFAYLSACHTTVGDEESPDEVIHLAAAMQFSGFRSVIGTMWAVDDGHTNSIATKFYDNVKDESGCLDHTRAAFALNQTMRTFGSSLPLDQRVLYIHIGA